MATEKELSNMLSLMNRMIAPGPDGTYRLVAKPPRTVSHENLLIKDLSFEGLKNYVTVRKGAILLQDPKVGSGSHLRVSKRERTIHLVLREHGGFQAMNADYMAATNLQAVAKFSEDHEAVKKMMASSWTADNLHLTVRNTQRHLFADDGSWRNLWTTLRNTSMEVKRIVEAASADDGARKKSLDDKLINAPVITWQLSYPIFENTEPVIINFEIMYDVSTGMPMLKVMSDPMTFVERTETEKIMKDAIDEINETLAGAIPVLYLN